MNTEFPSSGKLEIICGSMFSGKSEELIRRLKRAKIARKSVIVFKHSFDNRTFLEYVVSHDGSKIEAIALDNPLEILERLTADVEVVGIDEVQFFPKDIINVIMRLIEAKKHVIVAGLNLDFRSVPFGPMPILMAIADDVTKLAAICVECGKDAYFTQRIVNGTPAKYSDPIIQVGAQEQYEARCRGCFIIDKKPVWQNLQ